MHLGPHILLKANHSYETLNCSLPDEEFPVFKNKILEYIEQTIEVQHRITRKTARLIKKNGNLQKKSTQRLDKQLKVFMEFSLRTEFT